MVWLLIKSVSTFSIFSVPYKEFHPLNENNIFYFSLNSYLELHLIVFTFESVDAVLNWCQTTLSMTLVILHVSGTFLSHLFP